MSKVIKIHKTGIEVLSDEILENIKKKNLSPSTIESILNCPADWVMETFVLGLIEHEEPIHLTRGTLFHSAMEEFFALENKSRTGIAMKNICENLFKEEYKSLNHDLETKHWLAGAINNYFSMGFNYQNENIAKIKISEDSEIQPGLECFVKNNLFESKRPVLGFIDRVLLSQNNKLIIDDWKTGKRVSKFNKDKKISQENSFGYYRQQTIYALLLEALGYEIEDTRLIFPVAKEIVDIPFKEDWIRKQVEEDINATNLQLDSFLEKSFFPFKNQIFCSWCKEFNPSYRGRAKAPRVNQMQLVNLTDYN